MAGVEGAGVEGFDSTGGDIGVLSPIFDSRFGLLDRFLGVGVGVGIGVGVGVRRGPGMREDSIGEL